MAGLKPSESHVSMVNKKISSIEAKRYIKGVEIPRHIDLFQVAHYIINAYGTESDSTAFIERELSLETEWVANHDLSTKERRVSYKLAKVKLNRQPEYFFPVTLSLKLEHPHPIIPSSWVSVEEECAKFGVLAVYQKDDFHYTPTNREEYGVTGRDSGFKTAIPSDSPEFAAVKETLALIQVGANA